MSESTADRDPFERLAEEFAERLRRGEHPAITEYVARYPEHADDIRELMSGNICRCGAYPNIVAAIQQAMAS